MAETVAPPATEPRHQPVGTLNVVDPHPLNWLFITWNTMEEPIRVDEDGHIAFALATDEMIAQVDGARLVEVAERITATTSATPCSCARRRPSPRSTGT